MPDDVRVTLPSLPSLTSLPATEHPGLVAAPVATALAGWAGAAEVAVVDIDPDLADTAAMSEAYDIPMTASGNCVVVSGARAGEEQAHAQMGFETAHDLAEGGLGHAQFCRRAGKALLFGDGDEGRKIRHLVRAHLSPQ